MNKLMEKLVFDVVRSVIGDEAIGLTLEFDFAVLDVDQLDITYIVLALETRLGFELPTHLEDARTVAELVTGARDALRANAATKLQFPERNESPPTEPAVLLYAAPRVVDRFGGLFRPLGRRIAVRHRQTPAGRKRTESRRGGLRAARRTAIAPSSHNTRRSRRRSALIAPSGGAAPCGSGKVN